MDVSALGIVPGKGSGGDVGLGMPGLLGKGPGAVVVEPVPVPVLISLGGRVEDIFCGFLG